MYMLLKQREVCKAEYIWQYVEYLRTSQHGGSMPGSTAKESFDEQYAFDSIIGTLLAAVKGEPIVSLPDEQVAVVDTEYHVIVNVFQRQSNWFERHFARWSGALACEYVRIKLLERVKDNPIPLTKSDVGGLHNLVAHLAEIELRHHRGEIALNEVIQIDVRKVTCFMDGKRRRFVAHFNAVNVSF